MLLLMDGYSGKKAHGRLLVSGKGSSLILRGTATNRDQDVQVCNRIGCSGRLNSAKSAQLRCTEKTKSLRSSFRSSSSGKERIGSSPALSFVTNNSRKSLSGPRKKLSSKQERDSSGDSSSPYDHGVPELVLPPGKTQNGLHSESDGSGSSENASAKVGSSSVSSKRSQRSSHEKAGIRKLNGLTGSPVSLLPKSARQGASGGAVRCGVRKLRCSSMSDAITTESSTPESNLTRQKDTVRKKIEGESSSFDPGKKIIGPSLGGRSSNSSPGISIADLRRNGNDTSNRDSSPASVRTRRSLGQTRSIATNHGGGNDLLPHESRMIPRLSQPIIPIDPNSPTSSHRFSIESRLSRSRSRPYGLRDSNCESSKGIRPSSPAELGDVQSPLNRSSFQHYNMDGVAEVLLALERIEQDEELSYEQLLVLETSLFLSGLNFFDQHRDMRLDIDNLSYEELLALEERMGNVCTALTEEALSECVEVSIYPSPSLEDAPSEYCGEKDDVKCSICQEEYVGGDEVGRLRCEHRYHIACIQQWLRMKNWCPICKASAAAESSSSLSRPPPSFSTIQ